MPQVQTMLKPAASAVHRSKTRFRVLVAGRRFGKSRLAETELVEQALTLPGSRSIYMAPTRVQAKQILWTGLKERLPGTWIRSKNETSLTITLINGSVIQLAGADYADALRGISAHFICVDEFCFVNDLENQMAALRPMLSTTRGRMLLISTPAGGGSYSHDLFEKAKGDDAHDWEAWQFTSVDGGWIPPEEVDSQKATMDAALFRQEYFASFESLIGACYPEFGDANISLQEDDGGDLVVGMDFNVTPFCAIVIRVREGRADVINEITLHQSDTRKMSEKLLQLYPNRKITVAPDPTGSRTQTSSLGLSDHAILRQHGLIVKTPKSPWRIVDKVNVCRQFIRNGRGERNLQIDPSCKHLIRSLRNLEFKEGKSVPDPQSEFGHACDSLGYSLLALRHGLIPYSVGQGMRFS